MSSLFWVLTFYDYDNKEKVEENPPRKKKYISTHPFRFTWGKVFSKWRRWVLVTNNVAPVKEIKSKKILYLYTHKSLVSSPECKLKTKTTLYKGRTTDNILPTRSPFLDFFFQFEFFFLHFHETHPNCNNVSSSNPIHSYGKVPDSCSDSPPPFLWIKKYSNFNLYKLNPFHTKKEINIWIHHFILSYFFFALWFFQIRLNLV